MPHARATGPTAAVAAGPGAKDRDLALRCLRVFNDWVLDEWCGAAPGRFIPLVVVPLWDPRLAAEELERCVAKGARAVSFSENPHKLGLPSIHDDGGYWDPLLRTANDADVPLCIHFGSSSSLPTTSPDAPMVVWASLAPVNLMFTMVDWLFSRQLSKYENLKIVMAEGGIGWIPYLLERCDRTLRRGEEWYGQGDYEFDFALGRSALREGVAGIGTDVLPSELFRRHFYGCFIDDYVGVEQIGSIGVDNVMMESDYPHSDGSFPGTRTSVASMLDRFPEDQRWQLQCGNAIRLFDLVPSVPDVAARLRRSSPQEAPLS